MSTACGRLVVCGDYEGNLHAIVKILNCWSFDQDNAIKFEVKSETGNQWHPPALDENENLQIKLASTHVGPWIVPTVINAAYPTSWPDRIRYSLDNGTTVFSDQGGEALKQAKGCDGEWEPVDLETIGWKLAPFLTRGSLELATVAQEKGSAWWGRLVIRADGTGEFHAQNFESGECSEVRVTKFPDKTLSLLRLAEAVD